MFSNSADLSCFVYLRLIRMKLIIKYFFLQVQGIPYQSIIVIAHFKHFFKFFHILAHEHWTAQLTVKTILMLLNSYKAVKHHIAQPWYRCVLDTDVSLISERSRYRCVLGSDASFLRCLPPSPLERLTYRARAYCNCHFIKKMQTLYTVPKAFFDLAFFLEILSNYPLLSQ